MHASPRAAQACASDAENTIIPVAAPGLAATPLASISLSVFGSICRCNNSPTARESTLIRASSLLIILSFAKPTAIETAALGLRTTRIPSKICNLPFSIVNSISISSRNFLRISLAFLIRSLNITGSSFSRDVPLVSRVKNSASRLSDNDSRP